MFDALERGRKIEDHEGWKIRLSLFFSPSLSLSLEYLKKFKKFKEKEQEKRRKRKKKSGTSWILHITKDSLPSQKKNCTLSTVRASHISTPILYANPNPNLTRPTQRIVWQRRVPSQTRGISLFQNSSRSPFPPDKWSDYRFAYTHAHASIWKIRNSLVKRRNESIGCLGNKSRGEE